MTGSSHFMGTVKIAINIRIRAIGRTLLFEKMLYPARIGGVPNTVCPLLMGPAISFFGALPGEQFEAVGSGIIFAIFKLTGLTSTCLVEAMIFATGTA